MYQIIPYIYEGGIEEMEISPKEDFRETTIEDRINEQIIPEYFEFPR
jgi:hypothetical protein